MKKIVIFFVVLMLISGLLTIAKKNAKKEAEIISSEKLLEMNEECLNEVFVRIVETEGTFKERGMGKEIKKIKQDAIGIVDEISDCKIRPEDSQLECSKSVTERVNKVSNEWLQLLNTFAIKKEIREMIGGQG